MTSCMRDLEKWTWVNWKMGKIIWNTLIILGCFLVFCDKRWYAMLKYNNKEKFTKLLRIGDVLCIDWLEMITFLMEV